MEGRGERNRTEGEVREGWGRKGSDQKEGKGKGGKVEDDRKNALTQAHTTHQCQCLV